MPSGQSEEWRAEVLSWRAVAMAGLIGDAARAMIPLDSGQQVMALDARSGGRRKEERIPQWAFQETRELIAIRAELERQFTQTKRNKMLWELIAGRMQEKGFRRSADQCKCKWKNLVNRYKGKEISEPDNGRQCPFYEELDAIFKERSKSIDRLLLESDGGSLSRPSSANKRLKSLIKLSDEETDDEDELDDELSDDDLKHQQQLQCHQQLQISPPQAQAHPQAQAQAPQQKAKKRKPEKESSRARSSAAERSRVSSMQEVLEEFLQQQQRSEEQWRECCERREVERRGREAEWRSVMEKLERERLLREQLWWEREEQRRARDELRVRKRDELVEALLRKLIRDE